LYLDGDKDLPSHRVATFFSNRARTYEVSKVVDRIDAEEARCPFLADKKNKLLGFNLLLALIQKQFRYNSSVLLIRVSIAQ